MQTIGTFHGTEVDYAKEAVEARRLMGMKSTDLDRLTSTIAHLYLQCPEDMQYHYQALLKEIEYRKTMLDLMSSLDMDIPPKQNSYKTAFSPLFNVFVSITHAHQDVDGRWIYTCQSSYNPDVILKDHLFREEELERLCL